MPPVKRATHATDGPTGVVVAARMARAGTEQGKAAHERARWHATLNDDPARGSVGVGSRRMGS
jgi:hypothetical protein